MQVMRVADLCSCRPVQLGQCPSHPQVGAVPFTPFNSCGFQGMLEPPSIPTSKPTLIEHAVDMQGIEIYI